MELDTKFRGCDGEIDTDRESEGEVQHGGLADIFGRYFGVVLPRKRAKDRLPWQRSALTIR